MGGAGSQDVNGWYRRREARDGPPKGWPCSWTSNRQWSRCHWYEKDDSSHYIYQYNRSKTWWLLNKSCADSGGILTYYWIRSAQTGLPGALAEGDSKGERPDLTLRVVTK